MKNNNCIGVFDSGVGGLSVLRELKNLLPSENYIYFGDTLRVPYGDKSLDELIVCTKRILDFFKEKSVKMVVAACNTCSASTIELLKNDYDFEIIGMIKPTAKYISELNIKNLGVIATTATVKSNAYANSLKEFGINIFQNNCPELVKFVENGELDSLELQQALKMYLAPLLENNIEKLVLGCTHYPFLIPAMKKLGLNENMFINPAICVAKATQEYLKNNNLLSTKVSDCEFFVSGDIKQFEINSKLFFDKVQNVKSAN